MKLLNQISGFLSQQKEDQGENQDQKDSLIQTGREQFKKLQELGLQMPIAVL